MKAEQYARDALQLAEHASDRDLLLEAHHILLVPQAMMGELELSQQSAERVEALYDAERDRGHAFVFGHDPACCAVVFRALTLWISGYPERARDALLRAEAIARNANHQWTLAMALQWAAIVHGLRGDAVACSKVTKALRSVSEKGGFAYWAAWASFLEGWVLAQQAQLDEGIESMETGVAELQSLFGSLGNSIRLALLSEASGGNHEVDDALRTLEGALAMVGETDERIWESEIYRLKGEMLLRESSRPDQAGECFSKALQIAKAQYAKSFELRAATSLARLLRDTGRHQAARTMLAEIYGWFTEGFDTKDLKDAKSLLDELGVAAG
jgi:adenylate cyclase